MRNDAKISRLSAIPLFEGLSDRELDRVARFCTEVQVPDGRELCREGEPGVEFFVLESGRVSVSTGGRQVATLSAGDFFGELALLDAGPRNATVTADGDVTVLVLTRQEFLGVLEEEPIVAVRMLPAIGARLRAGARPPQEQPPVV